MAAIPDTLSRPRPQRAAHRPGRAGPPEPLSWGEGAVRLSLSGFTHCQLLLSVSGRVSPFDIRTIIASSSLHLFTEASPSRHLPYRSVVMPPLRLGTVVHLRPHSTLLLTSTTVRWCGLAGV